MGLIMKHKIWLELPKDIDTEIHAALATKVLHKLGYNECVAVWWNDRQQQYCLTINAEDEFLALQDHGHWFDLDFMAK